MSEIDMLKKRMRDQALSVRKVLPLRNRRQADADITRRFLSLPAYKDAHLILTYMSVGTEVATTMLIQHAFNEGKLVAVPRCLSGRKLEFVKISSFNQLESASFNLLEPKKDLPPISQEELVDSICVVPALTIDYQGWRIGYGAGYYDRFLSNYSGEKIGLIRNQNLSETALPHDNNDVAVDVIVTETQAIVCNR